MQAVVLDAHRKPDWDEFVRTCPTVLACHCYDWSGALKREYGLSFFPIAVYDGAEVCGILPLYHVETLRTGSALVSVPYVVGGGLVARDDDARQLLLSRAYEVALEIKAGGILLKQYKSRVNGGARTEDRFYEREVELSENLDDVWRNISAPNRRKVLEAEREEPDLEHPSSKLDAFYELLLAHESAAGRPCVSKGWLRCLLASGIYSIALLRKRDQVVAGTLVERFKDAVSFPLTGVAPANGKDGPFAYGLYWRLLEKSARAGARRFHSGALRPNEACREGWGGAKYAYYYQHFSVEGRSRPSLRARWKSSKILRALWKHVPKTLAKRVGPLILRQFP